MRLPAWRRARRIALIATAFCLFPAAISWSQRITGRYNVSAGIETVEWLRDHGASPLVSQVEDWYYTLNAPATGGPALRALPKVGVGRGAAAPTGPSATTLSYRPPRIPAVLHPALPGEGIWHPAAAPAFAGSRPPVMLTTLRPDPSYPQLVAGVAWIDSNRTRFTYTPGLQEPPVTLPDRGNGEVPPPQRQNLVATFNGGFKLQDAAEGFADRGHTYAPMVNGIGTLVQYRNGHVDVIDWHRGTSVSPDMTFARQNLPLIVDHRRLNPNLSDGPQWGATVGNAIRVWRSGIGVDRHGNLIYAAANDQTVGSLATILQRAGAVRALELDINEDWVSFITYRHHWAREPSNLLPDMIRPSTRYLTPDDRDFFAIYARGGPRPSGRAGFTASASAGGP
jgi:hypothetical protein